MIEFDRKWAMPNSATFTIKPIKEFVERNLDGCKVIIDPFARDCKYGTCTNDLNPEFNTDYHMDALDFLKMFDDESVDCVIYDPPFSTRQAVECYKRFGVEVTQETTSLHGVRGTLMKLLEFLSQTERHFALVGIVMELERNVDLK